jgi:hypothetical protein
MIYRIWKWDELSFWIFDEYIGQFVNTDNQIHENTTKYGKESHSELEDFKLYLIYLGITYGG